MIRTQIQLTQEQSRRVKAIAQEEGISMAQVIRDAIDAQLEERSEPGETDRWERSLSVIGRFHSGRSDIAENHDAYLAEAYADNGSPFE